MAGRCAGPPRAEALAHLDTALDELQAERRQATLVTGVDEDGTPNFGVPERHVLAVIEYLSGLLDTDQHKLEATRTVLVEGGSQEPEAGAEGRPSLIALSARWAELRRPTTTSRTAMRTAVARFERVNGPVPYADVTDAHARRFKDDLLHDATVRNASRTKQWGMMRTLLGVAVEDGLLDANPFTRVIEPALVILKLAECPCQRL